MSIKCIVWSPDVLRCCARRGTLKGKVLLLAPSVCAESQANLEHPSAARYGTAYKSTEQNSRPSRRAEHITVE